MNICHIITGLGDGGAEGVLYRLCVRDTENRHIVVSLMDEGKYGPLLQIAGVDVHCMRMPRGRVTLRGLAKLWRLLLVLRPDVVQTWMYHADLIGGIVARLSGVSVVFWGLRNTSLLPGLIPRSTILVSRACALLSRWVPCGIVSCSQESARVHQRVGYVERKFVIIPNGYDLTQFVPDTARRRCLRTEWGFDESVPLVGMVARFDPQKDHNNLILALAYLRNMGFHFCCILVGEGINADNEVLNNAINAAGLTGTIRLLGQRRDIPAVMNALDLHVLSSYSEAFPNVLAEAMACGTPCVTTDVGDAAMIVGDTGWVVPPRQPEALSKALADGLMGKDNAVEWRARCGAARERVERCYDIDRMVEKYRIVWEQARSGYVTAE